jgi:hypothetical protein
VKRSLRVRVGDAVSGVGRSSTPSRTSGRGSLVVAPALALSLARKRYDTLSIMDTADGAPWQLNCATGDLV